MKKTKTLFTLFAIFCLSITVAFTLSACENGGGKNHADLVAGTYICEDINYDKSTTKIILDKNGGFSFESKTEDGASVYESKISGNLTVDENKKVTSMKFESSLDFIKMNDYVFGEAISTEIDEEIISILKLLGDKISEYITLEFYDNYAIMESFDSEIVFYKEGAKKLESGTVLNFKTEKQLEKSVSLNLESLIFGMDSKVPPYESDYYFVKDEYNLPDEIEDLKDTISYNSKVTYVDKFGYPESNRPEIVELVDFDLTSTGTRNGVIKYEIYNHTIEKTVSYTVVKKEADLPLEQLYSLETGSGLYSVNYVAKGTKLYEKGYQLTYSTLNSKYYEQTLLVNEGNCVGENKVIDIIGYDETKTGLQTVTFKFRDEEIKCAFYVYDETLNPVISVDIEGKVIINKNGDKYTMDCSSLKFKLKKADESTETVDTVTEAQAVNLIALKDYTNDDKIIFAYKYQFGGKTYTFYCKAAVTTKEAV